MVDFLLSLTDLDVIAHDHVDGFEDVHKADGRG